MSRRLPTSPLAGVLFLLVVSAVFTPFLAVPAAGFGERPYEWNQVVAGTNNLAVHSAESVAQSFIATDAYRLLNVTLRVRNVGDTTDALNVTIRPDDAGVPSNTYLAAAQIVIGTNTLGNYDIAFATPPALARNTRYWIVATCASLSPNRYEWHHSAADVYPGGQAKINLNIGGGWVNPANPTDMYFVTFGREVDANLTATIRAVRPEANAGDLVTFRVHLNNSGGFTSPTAWLNDTQLPGLVFVSDTAQAVGASTPWPDYTFPNVGNGPRSFDLMARVPIGTEPGTVVTKAFTLSYVNNADAIEDAPGTQASILVGKVQKQVYLNPDSVGSSERLSPVKPTGGATSQHNETLKRDESAHDFDLAPALARSFRVSGVSATLYLDSPNHDAKSLDINLTFSDWNGVTLTPLSYVQRRVVTNNFNDYQPFAFAFPAVNHTFPTGGGIRLTVRNMGSSGADAVLAMNSTFASSGLSLNTTTYVRIDVLDLRDATGSTVVWSPQDTLVVQANISDPFGSAEIRGARVNIASPSGSLVVNNTAMAVLAVDPASPSAWKLYQFAYGPSLAEGTYAVEVTGTESNGVVDIAAANALVRLPHFSLVKTSTMTNVRSGDKFAYDIWFNNTGPGTAGRVWLNDSLPGELTFLSSSDPVAQTGSYNWSWTTLTSGNYHLGIDVQVKAGLPPVPYARNFVFLNFTDEKGFQWPMEVASADVAFHGPVISFTTTGSQVVLHANETITYTIVMQNTGEVAQTLWVNDSLPASVSYVSDTASSIGGTRSESGNDEFFRFSDMPAMTTWSFSFTARAGPALVRGAALTNGASLNYTNANGFLLPPRSASWTVVVHAPAIPSASVTIDRIQATPSDIVAATVTFPNLGNEPARDVWANLTLDPDLTFVNASVQAFGGGSNVRFVLANVAPGAGIIYLNASVSPDVSDHQSLPINGTLAYTDGFRNLLPMVLLNADAVEASAPRIVLSVNPQLTSVEAGTAAFFNIYQVNAGSGVAGDVWLTLPLPAGFINSIADTSNLTGAARTVLGSTYTWHWANVAPGPKSFSMQVQAKPTVLDGTSADLVFRADYTDANGNVRSATPSTASVQFRAPQVELVLGASPLQARPGDTITYDLTIRNLGNTTIRNLWLTDALDPRFEFVSFTARVPQSGQNPLNWSYADFAPGQVETLTLVLRLRTSAQPGDVVPNSFEVVYTNSAGTVIGFVRSESPILRVVSDPLPLVYLIVGLAVLALLAVFAVVPRIQAQIEEVFLVYRDGVLIYHLSRSLSQDKDEDVLSGMLTAVQEFVRDAFVYGEHRELHQLNFGDYGMLIERGQHVYLAVLYSGKGTAVVRRKIRTVLDQIEVAYGRVLQDWDGDMDTVVGARDLIREYLLRSNGRHAKAMLRIP